MSRFDTGIEIFKNETSNIINWKSKERIYNEHMNVLINGFTENPNDFFTNLFKNAKYNNAYIKLVNGDGLTYMRDQLYRFIYGMIGNNYYDIINDEDEQSTYKTRLHNLYVVMLNRIKNEPSHLKNEDNKNLTSLINQTVKLIEECHDKIIYSYNFVNGLIKENDILKLIYYENSILYTQKKDFSNNIILLFNIYIDNNMMNVLKQMFGVNNRDETYTIIKLLVDDKIFSENENDQTILIFPKIKQFLMKPIEERYELLLKEFVINNSPLTDDYSLWSDEKHKIYDILVKIYNYYKMAGNEKNIILKDIKQKKLESFRKIMINIPTQIVSLWDVIYKLIQTIKRITPKYILTMETILIFYIMFTILHIMMNFIHKIIKHSKYILKDTEFLSITSSTNMTNLSHLQKMDELNKQVALIKKRKDMFEKIEIYIRKSVGSVFVLLLEISALILNYKIMDTNQKKKYNKITSFQELLDEPKLHNITKYLDIVVYEQPDLNDKLKMNLDYVLNKLLKLRITNYKLLKTSAIIGIDHNKNIIFITLIIISVLITLSLVYKQTRKSKNT
jgi:hypothetical protein